MHWIKNQKGAVAVLVAAGMVAFLGMGALVVDIGNMRFTQSQLASVTESAVLAGAQELPRNSLSTSESVARQYAQTNGQAGDVVVDVHATGPSATNIYTIDITVSRQAPAFFSGIFGQGAATITEHAQAMVGPSGTVPGIVPFVLPDANYQANTKYTMKMYADTTKNQLDYMNVGIENISWDDYIKSLTTGYMKEFKIGQSMQYYAPSSGGQPSVDAFCTRIQKDTNTDHTKATAGELRVMLVPIVEKMLPRNTAEGTAMKIVRFAAIYLQYDNHQYGTNHYANIYFITDMNIGSGAVVPGAANGIWATELVQSNHVK